MKFLEALWW